MKYNVRINKYVFGEFTEDDEHEVFSYDVYEGEWNEEEEYFEDWGHIDDYQIYEGKYIWNAVEELLEKYEEHQDVETDEDLGVFDTAEEAMKALKEHANDRFPNCKLEI